MSYSCEILNGATENGNRTVLKMKNDKLSEEVSVLEGKKNSLKAIIKEVEKTLTEDSLGFDPNYLNAYALLKRLKLSEEENKVLRQCIKDNGLKVTHLTDETDMKRIYFEIEGQKCFYANGYTIDSDYDSIVIDCKDDYVMQHLPSNVTSFVQENHILNESGVYVTKDNGKTYYLFVANNSEDIVHNLLVLKEIAKNCRVLSFPELSYDEYEFAERILPTCDFNTEVRIGGSLLEKQMQESVQRIHEMFGIGSLDDLNERVLRKMEEMEQAKD